MQRTRFEDSKLFWKKSKVYMTYKVRGLDGNRNRDITVSKLDDNYRKNDKYDIF
jgi:hypothetical protein